MKVIEDIITEILECKNEKLKNASQRIKNALAEKNFKIYKINVLQKERQRDRKCIPEAPGLYFVGQWSEIKELVLLPKNEVERLPKIKDGSKWYLDKDYETLEKRLDKDKELLYIGKASGKEGLKKRITAYINYLSNNPITKKHNGGRAIWQIQDATENLEIFWISFKELGIDAKDVDPKVIETLLLMQYKLDMGDYPFANWSL